MTDPAPHPEKPALPIRQTSRLHAGRISAIGARYFITFVTHDRNPWLAKPEAIEAMTKVLQDWHQDTKGRILAATIMPDHIHVLCELGEGLTLGRCVARWKSLARQSTGYAGEWQRDFWEHRVQDHESMDEYALYIFLNPYRARLLNADHTWSGWMCPNLNLFRFSSAWGDSPLPLQEWLGLPNDHFSHLATGKK